MIYKHKDGRTTSPIEGSYEERLLKSDPDWKQDRKPKSDKDD